MDRSANPIVWGLGVFLLMIVAARADDHYSANPAGGQAVDHVVPMEAPVMVFVENPPVFFIAEPSVNTAGGDARRSESNWQAQAGVTVPSPGLVEAVLVPGLHQAPTIAGGEAGNQLDICLFGPDGKPRAFELFWREKGQPETITLAKTSAAFVDDRILQWDVMVPANFIVNKLVIDIADSDFVGQVDVMAMKDSEWFYLTRNAALYRNNRTKQAEIPVEEGAYKQFRLSFSGFDKTYEDTPLLVERVQAVGARSGRDYETVSFPSDFETVASDRTTDIRIALPGSGIWIEDVKITTDALFQGEWQVGRESAALGRREFSAVKTGGVARVDGRERELEIRVGQYWAESNLAVRMTSNDYFGGIQAVAIRARIPRLVFLADTAGRYIVQTGRGNRKEVFDQAPVRDRAIDHAAVFADITRAPANAQIDLAGKYNIAGGPFHDEGYTWTADVRIDEPGFYRVTLDERACLDDNIAGLRLVRDGSQIPYFFGPVEERRLRLETVREYDADQNRSVFTVRLPFASPQWSAVQVNADGLFERTFVFEKHVPGKEGWQPWKTRHWANRQEQPAYFRLELTDFPGDQNEIRLVIDHGDDQPLDIKEIAAVYGARDMFFLASAPGTYKLFGGNPEAPRGSYKDFEMIKEELMAVAPKQAMMGPVETMRPAGEKSLADNDVGGPFDDGGYTWASPLAGIVKPGFYQLRLNQRASLEDNRGGLRLIRSNQQVPFFMGTPQQKQIGLTAEKAYDRDKNETAWLIRLPQPSVHWLAIRLVSEGVFSREVVAEIRKPGKTGWQPWKRTDWIHRTSGGATLEIPLAGFPKDQTDIRLIMAHGDNQPIEIKELQAVYATQDLFFIAGGTGDYKVVGGNPKAPAPSYDLALIRDHVLKSEPIKIAMDEIETLKPAAWKAKLGRWFSEQGWGLYAVLGLVTLILLVVIVRLFPKEGEAEGGSDD